MSTAKQAAPVPSREPLECYCFDHPPRPGRVELAPAGLPRPDNRRPELALPAPRARGCPTPQGEAWPRPGRCPRGRIHRSRSGVRRGLRASTGSPGSTPGRLGTLGRSCRPDPQRRDGRVGDRPGGRGSPDVEALEGNARLRGEVSRRRDSGLACRFRGSEAPADSGGLKPGFMPGDCRKAPGIRPAQLRCLAITPSRFFSPRRFSMAMDTSSSTVNRGRLGWRVLNPPA